MADHNRILEQFSQLIETRIGLSALTQQRVGLAAILSTVFGSDWTGALHQLRHAPEADPQWQHLIHALTIGETYFLRDKLHFKILRESILPDLTAQKRQHNNLRLVIWCAGCSTGEEAYSVAIALREFLPDFAQWHLTIVATDVNERAVRSAQQATYRQWSFRHTSADFQQRYFQWGDERAQLRDEIRQMVRFRRANMLHETVVVEADIIFCRHVLLYFSDAQAIRAEEKLYHALGAGGWLLLGQVETLHMAREAWITHIFPGTPIYQKPPLQIHTTSDERIRYRTRLSHRDTRELPRLDLDAEPLDAAYARAIRALRNEQYAVAEQTLARVLTDHPRAARAHMLLASIQANRQAYPEATAHIEAALAAQPLLADAHYVRALIQLECDDTPTAIASLQAALYCDRGHTLAAYTLGSIFAQRGDTTSAQRHLRNADHSLQGLSDDSPVSDLSPLVAGVMRQRIAHQLRTLTS